MLDVAIAGGGLCGLALADRLQALGHSFALFEARPRFGGRILSVQCANGLRADLGPAWFWPKTQPAMVRLLKSLGIGSFPQHDLGAALVLSDADQAPSSLEGLEVHSGARRAEAGMAAVIDALVHRIPAENLHLNHVLTRAVRRSGHVDLHFRTPSGETIIPARRVVLAIPPRLLSERVKFEPALDAGTAEAMQQTHTWMSAQAKVVVAYSRPPSWRDAGKSGNAFVQHEQAVLSEVYDACDGTSKKAALGGFLALAPDLRKSFQAGLPMLIGNQMAQLFGPAFEEGEQHYLDWAEEEFTCASPDRVPPAMHPHYGAAPLTLGLWDGRLFLGGTETALDNGGFMGSALNAAERIERQLVKEPAASAEAAATSNATCLAEFTQWVAARQEAVFQNYKQRLTMHLRTSSASN